MKYPLRFFVTYCMFKLYHSKQIKNCMKSTSVTKVATMKNMNGAALQLKVSRPSIIIYKVKYPLCFFFNSFHSNMNQDLIEKHLYNQCHNYGKYGWFSLCMQRKPSSATTKPTLAGHKNEWNTKEDTSYLNCMYCDMSKGTSLAEAMRNSGKNQGVILWAMPLLTIIHYCGSWLNHIYTSIIKF